MLPLVSCVMPTRDRPTFIRQAVACFEAQTYPNKELVVVDNGDPIKHLLPAGVRYRHVGYHQLTTGAMRNAACELATGPIIAHWDDDDYSHPARLKEQMKLMVSMCVSLTGYNSMFFIDESNEKAWLYRNPEFYALGTSLVYSRDYWRGGKFPDQDVAEDSQFIERAQWRRAMAVCDANDRLIARIHPANTCDKTKYLIPPMWTPVQYASVAQMLPIVSTVKVPYDLDSVPGFSV